MAKLSKKIILVGRTASGKDTLKNELCRVWNLTSEISYTTRLPREGEVEGITYHYISRAKFEQMISDGKMMEHDFFNGNYYGTSWNEFDSCDVMIMTPEGVKHTRQCFINANEFIVVVYLETTQQELLNRLTKRYHVDALGDISGREKVMEIIRQRIHDDNVQFEEFERTKAYDLKIDSNQSLELLVSLIQKYI